MSGIPTPALLYNCCLKNAEPVWSRFRSLSVSGVRDLRSQTGVDETECVACPDAEAQFWTVYGRTKEGDSEALTDAPTKAAALVIAGFHMARARVAGVPLDIEEWAALRAADADHTDAARWRALMSSQRIRVIGSAGLVDPTTGELRAPADGYAHIGIELWSLHRSAHPDPEFPQDRCREQLTFYADFLRTNPPVRPPIPSGVYYRVESNNFYDMAANVGMGMGFWKKWRDRKHEFPTEPGASK